MTSAIHSLPEGVVDRVVDAFYDRFPGRILAVYSTGSYSGGYAVAGSDLDLVFIFSGKVSEAERKEGAQLIEHLSKMVALELDLDLRCEVEEVRPALKFDSTFIRGTDVRERLQVMSVSYWIRERMHAGCWLMCHLFGRTGVAQIPLPFANPSEEFFGYNTDRGGAADGSEGSTKDLVRAMSWAATALVGRQSEDYVTSKAHLLSILHQYLPSEWALFVEDLFRFCRMETNYGVPKDPGGRKKLRDLCRRTGEFESYFLGRYREFLLEEMEANDSRTSYALDRIIETPFRDNAIREKIMKSEWKGSTLQDFKERAVNAIERC